MQWGNEWDQTQDVIVTFTNGQRVRFVVGVCSEMAVAKYRLYLKEAQRYIDANFSVTVKGKTVKIGSLPDEEINKLDEEAAELYMLGESILDQLNKWAAIRAALRDVYVDVAERPDETTTMEPEAVEINAADAADVDVDEPVASTEPQEIEPIWKKEKLPEVWVKPGLFVENVPSNLVSAIYMQVNALNPGIFTMWGVPTQKKIVKISIG